MEQAVQEVQKIEGISPQMLWTFLIVLVGLATLFILGHKVERCQVAGGRRCAHESKGRERAS